MYRTRTLRRPRLEALEARDCPSSVALSGGTLSVVNELSATLSPGATPGSVNYTVTDPGGQVHTGTAAGVTRILDFNNVAGSYFYSSVTAAPTDTYTFGPGARVTATAANSSFHSYGPNSTMQDTAGGSTFYAYGPGESDYGGNGDTFYEYGNGASVYDIVGKGAASVTVGPHAGVDSIRIQAGTLSDPQAASDMVYRFNTAAPFGSGTFAEANGVDYYAGKNGLPSYVHYYYTDAAGDIGVDYLNAAGQMVHVNQAAGTVSAIADFGGTGKAGQYNVLINDTLLPDTQYGQGNQGAGDLVVGGFGSFDLEKVGGGDAAAFNVIVGRSFGTNDLNGGAQANSTSILIANPAAQENYFRFFTGTNVTNYAVGYLAGRDVFMGPTTTPPAGFVGYGFTPAELALLQMFQQNIGFGPVL